MRWSLAVGAAWIGAAISAVSVGFAAGPVAWRLAGESGQVIGAATAAPASEALRVDLAPILAFAPFGRTVAVPASPQAVGETGLGLTLLGVTVSMPSSQSRAIIAGGDSGRADSYAVGSNITAGATLAEVTRTHVVLSVEGRLETLSFAKPGATKAPAGRADLRNLIPSNTATASPAADGAEAVIARYRAAILQNPKSVMDRLGLEATGDGYRISDAASPGVRQAGFRPGDLVTSVNGQKVGDVASDQRYFDVVAASGKARVEVQRDGQTIVMTFPLQ